MNDGMLCGEAVRPNGGTAPARRGGPAAFPSSGNRHLAGLVRRLGLRVLSVCDTSHFRENRYPEDGWYPWVFERSAQF